MREGGSGTTIPRTKKGGMTTRRRLASCGRGRRMTRKTRCIPTAKKTAKNTAEDAATAKNAARNTDKNTDKKIAKNTAAATPTATATVTAV